MEIGLKINVPFESVVPINVNYTYELMLNNINSLKKIFPFLSIGNIGRSVLGKDIPFIKLGTGSKEVMYSGSIHANEWITAVLLMKFIENFSISFVQNSNICGYSARKIFNQVSLYIIPMANPDGVNLVTGAIKPNTTEYISFKKIANNFPQVPFPSGWKANSNGVDFKDYQPIYFYPLYSPPFMCIT